MYAGNVASPAQLPLVSGCRNSGAYSLLLFSHVHVLATETVTQEDVLTINTASPGDVLTDVSVWAGQTMYSAHRLVLALSSSYFRY